MDRRSFLQIAGGTVAGPPPRPRLGAAPAGARPRQPAPLGRGGRVPPAPFTLGVASGDPAADSVVLWTRLAPDPLVPGGGMPTRAVPVDWQVAADDRFRHVVRHGTEVTHGGEAHAVHAEVGGLLAECHLRVPLWNGDAS